MATAVRFDPLPRNLHGDPRFQALLAKMKLDDWKRKVAAIILLPALAALVASGCAAVGPPIQKPCFHANEPSEKDIGYCQAVRVGNTLYISGTAGEGDMASAIRSVYDRLQRTLEANGLTFANVVKENVYATDLDAFIQNKDLRKKFYGQTFPVATWIQVQRLYVPSLVVEVELTAVYSPRPVTHVAEMSARKPTPTAPGRNGTKL